MGRRTVNAGNRLIHLLDDVIYDQGHPRPFINAGLRTAALVYEGALRLRARYYRRHRRLPVRLPCRVVSIGNLSLGGTGKTPFCLYLAKLIHDAGYRVAIISRGYRSTAERAGAVIEPDRPGALCAQRLGDEPVLMARRLAPRSIPILVGGDRVASGRRALARFQPDVILLDDGFQHRRLARDLDIVLLDGTKPIGNGYLLPRGPLREPTSALSRAHILIRTRCPRHMDGNPAAGPGRRLTPVLPALAGKPVFTSRHRAVGREYVAVGSSTGPPSRPLNLTDLQGLPVHGFAGIARNETFRQSLTELGADIRAWSAFRDHHHYQAADLAHLARTGQRTGAVALVTTDKDRVRIPDGWIRQLPLMVVGVRIEFNDDAEAFERLVFDKLGLIDRREVRP